MRFALLLVALILIPSLVSGGDPPSVWLPRVAITRQVTKNVTKAAVGGCVGGVCKAQKSVLVKKETVQVQNRVLRFRFWR